MARTNAEVKEENVKVGKKTVKSLLDRDIWHNDIVIGAKEVVTISTEDAKHLVELGYCEEISSRVI